MKTWVPLNDMEEWRKKKYSRKMYTTNFYVNASKEGTRLDVVQSYWTIVPKDGKFKQNKK